MNKLMWLMTIMLLVTVGCKKEKVDPYTSAGIKAQTDYTLLEQMLAEQFTEYGDNKLVSAYIINNTPYQIVEVTKSKHFLDHKKELLVVTYYKLSVGRHLKVTATIKDGIIFNIVIEEVNYART